MDVNKLLQSLRRRAWRGAANPTQGCCCCPGVKLHLVLPALPPSFSTLSPQSISQSDTRLCSRDHLSMWSVGKSKEQKRRAKA
ncbi:uncharacterized protein B0I36DRAFT_329304 [Microdochium trichocladiopsis]|uniref:Uncharacterized protein n=1 Tax=Microdochium trichocladiopsis TaxID=1682393 RepID=A0A9P8XZR1_9PEZI|nr:uncharacterized protein B0I36DRAFT_329304 [Microdochium trichocladiopsis]KAH7025865.1 hypothetical protein B0I36DRAFT_329304 [Microdochium trichocladiopsis]